MSLGLPARGSGGGGGKRTRLFQVGIDGRMRGGVLTDLEQFLASAKWEVWIFSIKLFNNIYFQMGAWTSG